MSINDANDLEGPEIRGAHEQQEEPGTLMQRCLRCAAPHPVENDKAMSPYGLASWVEHERSFRLGAKGELIEGVIWRGGYGSWSLDCCSEQVDREALPQGMAFEVGVGSLCDICLVSLALQKRAIHLQHMAEIGGPGVASDWGDASAEKIAARAEAERKKSARQLKRERAQWMLSKLAERGE